VRVPAGERVAHDRSVAALVALHGECGSRCAVAARAVVEWGASDNERGALVASCVLIDELLELRERLA
jgi:hypothetical protein